MYEPEPDQYLLDLQERDKPTLDNFVVGANGEAVSVLREVAAGCGPTFVYLYGPKGAGANAPAQKPGARRGLSRAAL